MNPSAAASTDRQVLITRVFDAPRALVFQAWTDPAQLARWFAPPDCSIEFRRLDIRPGGSFHSCVRSPEGHECWCTGVYREVIPPERIVLTMVVADREGRELDPVAAGMDPAWPRETTVTVTFAERDGQTVLTLRQTVDEALAKRTGAHPSWLQMFDRLAAQLAGVSKP